MKEMNAQAEEALRNAFAHISLIHHVETEERDKNGFRMVLDVADGKALTSCVGVLSSAFPRRVSAWIDQNREREEYLIVTAPYISDRSAQICEQSNVGYCDLSGNCRIATGGIFLLIRGMPNQYPADHRARTLFSPSSAVTSMILRELLAQPGKRWRVKELAQAAGCSLGMVSRVTSYLRDQEWAVMDQSGFSLQDPEELLCAWSEQWMRRKDRRISCYSPDSAAVFEKKCAQILQEEGIRSYLTGFSGGARYAPVVRYRKVHLWIRPEDVQKFMAEAGIREVDSGANVILYPAFSEDVLAHSREIGGNLVVSPVQAWLDCMSLKGRGEEMAKEIYRREIGHDQG